MGPFYPQKAIAGVGSENVSRVRALPRDERSKGVAASTLSTRPFTVDAPHQPT